MTIKHAILILKSRFVSPVLTYLNSVVDSDIDWGSSYQSDRYPFLFLDRLRIIHNEETYQGLKNFLNRLIEENPKNKNLFITWTVFSLIYVGLILNNGDSVDMLRKVLPGLKECEQNSAMITVMVEYFDKFNEHEGIKGILTNGLTDGMPDVEEKCIELLEKHDPDFVKEWKTQKETTNTENEES